MTIVISNIVIIIVISTIMIIKYGRGIYFAKNII